MLYSWNVSYHEVQNIFSYRLLSENVVMKARTSVILPVVLYGYKSWSVKLN
jgi:hypothetical protein